MQYAAEAKLVFAHGVQRIYVTNLPFDEDLVVGQIRLVDEGGILLDVNAWNLRNLYKNATSFDDSLFHIYKRMYIRRKVKNLNINISGELVPFQLEGVHEIDRRRGVILLADDMGLGKTIQSIAWLTAREPFPCIILCPAHLKYNWEYEFKKFAPHIETEVLSGLRPYVPTCEEVLIINYDILRTWHDTLCGLKPSCVIGDEFHALKNKSSGRSVASDILFGMSKYRLAITGTPMKTSTSDLWNLMRLLDPNVLGGWTTFANEFCDAKKSYRFRRVGKRLIRTPYYDTSGVSQPERLHRVLIKTYMVRRTKKDVELQLPTKVRTIIPIDPGKFGKEIRELEKTYLEDVVNKKVNKKSFSALRLRTGRVKIASNMVFQWIDAYLLKADKPLIVVCWHRASVVDVIFERYQKIAVRITGAESSEQKHKAAQLFQDGKSRILVCNAQSAGTGLTLTRTDTMLFVELPVDAADLDQMEDRICRISQKAQEVHYYYFVIRNSLEQRVMEIVDQKKTSTSLVIDGISVSVSDLLLPISEAADA